MASLESRKKRYKEDGGREPGEVLVLPELVQNLGDIKDTYGVFEDNRTIKKVIIPPTITYIPARTFRGCINLEEIEFPCKIDLGVGYASHPLSIGEEAFRDCVKLKKLVFHGEMRLGKRAFLNCTSLEEVTYGELFFRNYSIEDEAFYNCTALREVTLPKVFALGCNVFDKCSSLKIIRVADEKNFKNKKRSIFDKVEKGWKGDCSAQVQWAFEKEAVARHFTLSDEKSKTIDPNYAFKPVYGGEEVVVIAPGTVSLDHPKENPNHGLFEGNQTIKKVVLPASLVTIAPRTFFGCTNLETIVFDSPRKQLTLNIGAEAFRGCCGLKNVTLPGLVVVAPRAFAECKALQSITFDAVPKECMPAPLSRKAKHAGCYVQIERSAFFGCESLSEVNFKSNIGYLNDYAFEDCTSLETIELPYVSHFGERVFSGCTNLKTIYRAQRWRRFRETSFKSFRQSEKKYRRGCSAKVRGCKTKVKIPR